MRLKLDNAQLQANVRNPFGKFRPEREEGHNAPKIARSPAVDSLVKLWSEFDLADPSLQDRNGKINHLKCYNKITRVIKGSGIKYSNEDVISFVISLAPYEDTKQFFSLRAGLWISALVNAAPTEEYIIDVNCFSSLIDNIGYQNRANLTVNGSVGRSVAYRSRNGGRLIINGSAGDYAGSKMKPGSKLQVNGSVGDGLGYENVGGRIIVSGSSGQATACNMCAGFVVVKGSAGDKFASGMRGGCLMAYGNVVGTPCEDMEGGEVRFYDTFERFELRRGSAARIYRKNRLIWPTEKSPTNYSNPQK